VLGGLLQEESLRPVDTKKPPPDCHGMYPETILGANISQMLGNYKLDCDIKLNTLFCRI